MKIKILIGLVSIGCLVIFLNCNYTPEQKKYVDSIEKEREEKNDYMKNNPDSPFNQDEKAHYEPLKYYNVDPDFVFKSKLYEFDQKDSIKILGTKGEERQTIKYGYLIFNYDKKDYNINVYKSVSRTGVEYFGIWFTDKTTGEETYGVGRYLDFEMNAAKDYVYTIDFNKAYNPYCAYSSKFSCAIPTKEDYLDLAINAGEKNFHQ